MLKIHQIDLKKQYASPQEELKAAKSYIYQLVEELRYRLGDNAEVAEKEEEKPSTEEIIGEAVRSSYDYIDAKGISADWIKTGVLRDTGSNFYFDLDNGVMRANSLRLRLTDHGNDTLNDYIDKIRKELEDQIDGNISSWFYDYPPAVDNLPASDWTTDELKREHIGDTFYDTESGYSYRWLEDESTTPSTFFWKRITDSDITKALAAAAAAQETADHKMTIFYGSPSDTYTGVGQGDYLINPANGKTYRWDNGEWINVTDYDTPISGLRTEIINQAGLISQKVSYTDYNGTEIASLINQTPEAVKIKASHIELTGEDIANRLNGASTSVVIDSRHLDLTSKADIDAVNELTTRMGLAETNIQVNAEEIVSTAERLSIDISDTNRVVTDVQSQIVQMASEISSKVDQTVIDTVNNRISVAESLIAQNADAITLKVSRAEVANTNLMPTVYADEPLTGEESITISGVTFTVKSDGKVEVTGKATSTATFYLIRNMQVDPQTTYTLSGCPSGGSTNTYCLRSSSYVDTGSGVTFKPSATTTSMYFYIRINSGYTIGSTPLVFAPQLEVGSAATSYKNPRGTSGRAMSLLRQTADGLEIRVRKGDLISSINTSPESITINANRLNLSGLVTISEFGNTFNSKVTQISGDKIRTGTIEGTHIKLGGENDQYGTLKLYGANNNLEAELFYNGMNVYKNGTLMGKIGTNLYEWGVGTWVAIDITNSAAGFEITNQATQKKIYTFSRYTTSGYGFKIHDSNGTERVRINPSDGFEVLDSNGTRRVSFNASNGFRIRDGNGTARAIADASEFALVSATSGQIFTANNTGLVRCARVEQYSKQKYKTNIRRFGKNEEIFKNSLLKSGEEESALELVKDTDIYSYNMAGDFDDGRTHYGVIIDGDYKCCEHIKGEDGVDTYSMLAVLWQAVRELAAQKGE